jgi:hypothetical protein
MGSKIIITQPLFYQETRTSTLYQLLSYEAGTDSWHVQNVIKGCESPVITDIDLSRISFNIKRFNTVMPTDFSAEAIETTDAWNYLESLGIEVFEKVFGFARDNEPQSIESHTQQVKKQPALV